MPTPSNYVGPEKVFGLVDDDGEMRLPGLPIIRPIGDYADSLSLDEKSGWMPPKQDKTHQPLYQGQKTVPPSLHEAVQSFILGCSIRALRGQENKHSSMLIHVTRLTDVQERVYEQVNLLMREFCNVLAYGEEGSREELMCEFKSLWNKDFVKTNASIDDIQCPPHEWSEVSGKILGIAQSIKVRRINGTAGDVLDYEQHKSQGLNVIAIGGDKLSRGLTLEGLIVSYFTRLSRMYDTLMQMGRWFGYRDGFVDICRLYAPQVLINWFEHITDASNELRKEFVLMHEMGDTPATFGQRVRSHPVLLVTSRVKMRYSVELTLSYQGAISETVVYSRAKEDVDRNYNAALSLFKKIDSYAEKRQRPIRLDEGKDKAGKYLWSKVKSDDVLEFLRQYSSPSQHVRKVNTSLLAAYIEKQIDNAGLSDWTVMLAGKEPSKTLPKELAGMQTGFPTRANHPKYSAEPLPEPNAYRIKRLVDPGDEVWDLTEEQYQVAMDLTNPSNKTKPGGPEIRVSRNKSQAMLLIYPLEHQEYTEPQGTDKPYIGFAISFSGNKKDKPITYRVNDVFQGQMDE